MTNWSFIETIGMSPESLIQGLETKELIEHQLDVDLPRLDVTINGKHVMNKDEIGSTNQELLRCCTQSVFAPALEYLVKVFPTVHILHNKDGDKSKIDVNRKPVYYNGILSYISPTIRSFDTNCIISTYFRAVGKDNLEPCFLIYMELFFNLESNKGTLLFRLDPQLKK